MPNGKILPEEILLGGQYYDKLWWCNLPRNTGTEMVLDVYERCKDANQNTGCCYHDNNPDVNRGIRPDVALAVGSEGDCRL